MVTGAIYDVGTGKVKWLPLEKVKEILAKVMESPGRKMNIYAE
jgi:carbonic anhydrase